ncbi:MAG TPA: hypothetical protein IAA75_08675 [Candidatus Pullichristensenella avicola]|nr:hypothetical protein [Candidatus Pullichristensenella avicola]
MPYLVKSIFFIKKYLLRLLYQYYSSFFALVLLSFEQIEAKTCVRRAFCRPPDAAKVTIVAAMFPLRGNRVKAPVFSGSLCFSQNRHIFPGL